MHPARLALIISVLIGNGCTLSTAPSAPDTVSSAPSASSQDVQPKAPQEIRTIRPFDGIVVHVGPEPRVEVAAQVCLEQGFLEQVACAPNSREHESLVVVTPAQPSQVHAALLLAGFTPGAPGHWTFDHQTLGTVAPTGERLDVIVRYTTAAGEVIEEPIRNWIRSAAVRDKSNAEPNHAAFPTQPWVFGGSTIAKNPPFMGAGEHYVADMTGSIIGLVTFGDETIGFSHVFSDQADVHTPEWEVNPATIPPLHTPVTLVLQRWRE